IATKNVVHAPIAVADMRLADLLDTLLQKGRIGAAGPVVIGRTIKVQCGTCPADRHLPVLPNLVDDLALPIRPQSFRLMTSCSISRSSVRSATIFFSRPFSSSSSRKRRISDGKSPAYFFFQLKYVAWLIPALRQISATGVPSSPCLTTNALCASVNFDAFMPSLLVQPRKHTAENSTSNWSSFQVAEQRQSKQ